MKITFAHGAAGGKKRGVVFCPACHFPDCPYHGTYIRKGFHRENPNTIIQIAVPRYRCLNQACDRRTFSVLPQHVLPYCRFFWPSLLTILHATAGKMIPSTLAARWHVSRRVILRAAALLTQMSKWIDQIHQEVCDGLQRSGFEFMVKMVVGKLGRIQLNHRWYRYRYPRRFPGKNSFHTIRIFSVGLL